MPLTRLLPLTALVLLSGCVYGVRERTEQVQCDLSLKPYDLAPPGQAEPPKMGDTPEKGPPVKPGPLGEGKGASQASPTDVQTAALLQADPEKPLTPAQKAAQRLEIPSAIPGGDTPRIDLKDLTPEQRRRKLLELYPDLATLEPEPMTQPGPSGKPYTLSDLQELATRFSPTIRQATADVEAARGNILQSRAYPNPTIGYEADPSSSGTTPTFQGWFIDQPIKSAGKLKLQEAAARMELENATLALRRARSDLSTQVRNAYFGVLVAWETLRVNRGVARLTDEVFQIQRDLSAEGFSADYETATLRAQADLARLAYRQSIFAYHGRLEATRRRGGDARARPAAQPGRGAGRCLRAALRLRQGAGSRAEQPYRHPVGPQQHREGPLQPQAATDHTVVSGSRRAGEGAEGFHDRAGRIRAQRHHRYAAGGLGSE